ncbi:hypothetical protein KJ975_10845 [Myxococcota bacterium]|nr:hypothetical protein [Myxococcota bacterium]
MFHVNPSRFVYRLSLIALLLSTPVFSGCIEAGLQSGVFACNTDSQCPPGGFFCDNYFNTYVYFTDETAEPVNHNYWGFCQSEKEVVKKQNNYHVEICTNGKDEDADSLIDCEDLECQTSPSCRQQLQRECGDGGSGTLDCESRLGFPLIRQPTGTETQDAETTCPLAVGYYGTGIIGVPSDQACLPRCRLYFPNKTDGMGLSDEEDFTGSDNYCNTIMNPLLITADRFQIAPYRCVHLNESDNEAGVKILNDVCVPELQDNEAGSTDCSVCTTQGKECLVISAKNRLNLAWEYNATEKKLFLKPIDDVGETVDATAIYCI